MPLRIKLEVVASIFVITRLLNKRSFVVLKIYFRFMYRYLKILSISSWFLFACNSAHESQSSDSPASQASSDFTKTLVGKTFFGILPCGSCPGIETRVILQTERQARLEQLYEENDEYPSILTGTYAIEGNILALSFTNKEDNQRYKIKSDSLITLLGEDDKEAEGETANLYNLRLVPLLAPAEVQGTYVKTDSAHKPTAQLKLSYNQSKQSYALEYRSADNACKLRANSTNSDANRVFFDLHDLHKEAKGTLTLTFSDTSLAIYVAAESEKEDVQLCCNNRGLTILGNYVKQNKPKHAHKMSCCGVAKESKLAKHSRKQSS